MNADAISDLILAVVAFSIAFVQLRQRPALAIGCGLIGLAAAIGTLHYQYAELFAGPHRFTGLVAAWLCLVNLCHSLSDAAGNATRGGASVHR